MHHQTGFFSSGAVNHLPLPDLFNITPETLADTPVASTPLNELYQYIQKNRKHLASLSDKHLDKSLAVIFTMVYAYSAKKYIAEMGYLYQHNHVAFDQQRNFENTECAEQEFGNRRYASSSDKGNDTIRAPWHGKEPAMAVHVSTSYPVGKGLTHYQSVTERFQRVECEEKQFSELAEAMLKLTKEEHRLAVVKCFVENIQTGGNGCAAGRLQNTLMKTPQLLQSLQGQENGGRTEFAILQLLTNQCSTTAPKTQEHLQKAYDCSDKDFEGWDDFYTTLLACLKTESKGSPCYLTLQNGKSLLAIAENKLQIIKECGDYFCNPDSYVLYNDNPDDMKAILWHKQKSQDLEISKCTKLHAQLDEGDPLWKYSNNTVRNFGFEAGGYQRLSKILIDGSTVTQLGVSTQTGKFYLQGESPSGEPRQLAISKTGDISSWIPGKGDQPIGHHWLWAMQFIKETQPQLFKAQNPSAQLAANGAQSAAADPTPQPIVAVKPQMQQQLHKGDPLFALMQEVMTTKSLGYQEVFGGVRLGIGAVTKNFYMENGAAHQIYIDQSGLLKSYINGPQDITASLAWAHNTALKTPEIQAMLQAAQPVAPQPAPPAAQTAPPAAQTVAPAAQTVAPAATAQSPTDQQEKVSEIHRTFAAGLSTSGIFAVGAGTAAAVIGAKTLAAAGAAGIFFGAIAGAVLWPILLGIAVAAAAVAIGFCIYRGCKQKEVEGYNQLAATPN